METGHRLTVLERVIRRVRLLLALGLVIVSGLAWAYLVRMASAMRAAESEAAMHAAMGMTMPGGEDHSASARVLARRRRLRGRRALVVREAGEPQRHGPSESRHVEPVSSGVEVGILRPGLAELSDRRAG